MALPDCRRCGTKDPQRMHGLMSLWFAPLIELEADLGYFYLCPSCHDEVIIPELERIQNRILELHPAHRVAEDAEVVAEDAELGAEGLGDAGDAGDAGGSKDPDDLQGPEDAEDPEEAEDPEDAEDRG